jgi:formate-dependent nitrite reductase membrane component NrfD
MFAANIWHWWIGVALMLVGILAVVALVLYYLKTVTAPQVPPESRRSTARERDL